MKKILAIGGVCAALAAGLCIVCLTGAGQRAALSVRICDAHTGEPLEEANVVVAETGERYTTDGQGLTPVMDVPYMPDARFNRILRRNWGEVTILAYADGYLPYALFHTAVWKSTARGPITLYLFMDDGSMDDIPFSVIEAPENDWAAALLKKFNPTGE